MYCDNDITSIDDDDNYSLYKYHAKNITNCETAKKCSDAINYFENLQNSNTLLEIDEIRKLIYLGYFCLGDIKKIESLERNKYTITFNKYLKEFEKERNEKQFALALQRFGIAGITSFLTGVYVFFSKN